MSLQHPEQPLDTGIDRTWVHRLFNYLTSRYQKSNKAIPYYGCLAQLARAYASYV